MTPPTDALTDGGEPTYRCPEYECGLVNFTGDELFSHLRWDHNRSESKAYDLYEDAEQVGVR